MTRITGRLGSIALMLLALVLSGCGGDGPDLGESPAGDDPVSQVWFEQELPVGQAAISLEVGESLRFALASGRGVALEFAGALAEGEASWLDVTLEPVGVAAAEATRRLELPMREDRVVLYQDQPGLAWLRLQAGGRGAGTVSLESPALSRLMIEDAWSGCGGRTDRLVSRPHLFIFMVDTLRADRLSVYGYERPTTPALDRFAESATVFEHGVAQAPWTRPSVASMFTGLTPSGHGVNDRDDALPDEAETLAEILRASGYQTAAIFTNGNVSDRYNFHQGFDVFRRAGGTTVTGSEALEEVGTILAARDESRPLFLYLHVNDPHAPYGPPEPFLSRWAPGVDPARGSFASLRPLRKTTEVDAQFKDDVLALYDADIAFTDHLFARFEEYLQEYGLWQDSAVLFVSDHGEQFWEVDTWGHGLTLAETLIRVPFLLRTPRQSCAVRSPRIAQHIDILPTFLALAGIEGHYRGAGENLLHPSLPVDRLAYSAVDKSQCTGVAMSTRDWKLVVSRSFRFSNNSSDLFLLDRSTQEREELNLRHQQPRVVEVLQEAILQHEAAEARLESALTPLDDELRRELEALGYLDPESGP